VPVGVPRFEEVHEVDDTAKHLKTKIADFFVSYRRLEPKKWVKAKEWKGTSAAEKIIDSASQLYKEEFRSI
jgi:inorganic pyrophosphatase